MMWMSRLAVRKAEGQRFLLRPKPLPAIDRSFGDPRLAAIRAAALEGGADSWPVVRGHLAAADGDEDLTFLVEGLGSVSGVERWIGDVAAAAPGDPLPLLVSGARHIGRAGKAPAVEQDPLAPEGSSNPLRERLEAAERHLLAAAGHAPSSAAPWYFLQISGRGLDIDPETAERRFEAVRGRAPGHAAAHREHVRQLARTSDGSHDRMHAFAREAMLAAPEGSRLGELVAMAHLEEWLAIGGDPESVHMGSRRVVGALHEAADRSVRHPAFVRRGDWILALNIFAMAFSLAGDRTAARPLFRELGTRATETPWQYLDERSPQVAFLEWRHFMSR